MIEDKKCILIKLPTVEWQTCLRYNVYVCIDCVAKMKRILIFFRGIGAKSQLLLFTIEIFTFIKMFDALLKHGILSWYSIPI